MIVIDIILQALLATFLLMLIATGIVVLAGIFVR